MKHLLQLTFASVILAVGLLVTPLATTQVSAVDVLSKSCGAADGGGGTAGAGVGSGAGASTGGGTSPLCDAAGKDKLPELVKNLVNLLLAVLGFIAVIMIIIGGIRYTTSNGDSSNTKAAKDTILYSVVGLVVAILAYAIVNFVIDFFISS